ncbi:THAP domain-containing protein 5-like isoform 1-T1 [Odontesthes bonariensis]|uniref:THAP domain-containing protein 5-like n=1 Tax=Odontesthes bonariensis TaxID=219752 RepID=UPI003F582FA6
MPRYCAVKCCRNRGGTSSRQDNKRISFYPFPLQDKPRLQKWVDNMRREEWTPSRHQYLCSEHFTEECFDIRWGIRYLKSTAIPTIFPASDDDGEKKCCTSKRSPCPKPSTSETDAELKGLESLPCKRPLILRKVCKTVQPNAQSLIFAEHSEMKSALSNASTSCLLNLPETQSTVCKGTGGNEISTVSCCALSPHSEPHSSEPADSTAVVLCCETLGPYSEKEAHVEAAALQGVLGQTFRFSPVETIKDKPSGCVLEGRRPSEGEHISVYEHSYCRPDTDRDQLWNKILGLHAKILELDRREESTVAKIQALENEMASLKRDGADFKEKQKVLEDYISAVLL